MSVITKKWDDVVGQVLLDENSEVVHTVQVTYGMDLLMPSLGYDKWDTEPERTAKDSSANIWWGGASTYMQECLQNGSVKWQRSPNAIEFGNGKEFCYKSKDKYGNQLFRFFRPDGSNVTIRLAARGLSETCIRYTLDAYDNPKGNKRGKHLWKREVEQEYLKYDEDSYEGYGWRLVTRLIMLYGARVLYACE